MAFFAMTGTMLYYGAVVAGTIKDPLMASLCAYGEEKRPRMASRFLYVLAAWLLMVAFGAFLVTAPGTSWRDSTAPLAFVLLSGMAMGAGVAINARPGLREALPRWYADLLRHATRQERQQLGRAWRRLPRRLRWRLNADQAAFVTWCDMVRLTVIYGAYDPESAWDRWT